MKTKFRLSLGAACLLLFLTSCNNNNGGSVTIQAEAEGSPYYTTLIDGPRYQVISLQNSSLNDTAAVTALSLTGTAASIVNRSGSGADPVYGNYPQCALTSQSNLLQENTIPAGGTCLVVLLGPIGDVSADATTGTFSVQASLDGNLYAKTFNLSNATYLYVGGDINQIDNVSLSSGSLLAECNGNTCSNFFGNASGLGANDDIFALTTDNSGNLYVGGNFNTLGNASAGSNYLLAKCSQASCSNFFGASSTMGANGGIFALATDQTGNLYAGGSFNTLGGANAGSNKLLARCSGNTCNNFFADNSSGANHDITDFVTDSNGVLYVGGEINTLGSASAGSNFLLARCTSNTCNNFFGNGSTAGADNLIQTLAFGSDGNLYVGGRFKTLDSATSGSNFLLAQCSGSTCSNFFGGNTLGANNPIVVIASSDNGIYVGGGFSVLGSASAVGILLARCSNNQCSNIFNNNVTGADASISMLTVDANSNLYVSGALTTLGTASTAAGSLLASCESSNCSNYFNNVNLGVSGNINAWAISNQLTLTNS